jgi:hypothetical protein
MDAGNPHRPLSTSQGRPLKISIDLVYAMQSPQKMGNAACRCLCDQQRFEFYCQFARGFAPLIHLSGATIPHLEIEEPPDMCQT